MEEGPVEFHLQGGGDFSTLFHTINICENKTKRFHKLFVKYTVTKKYKQVKRWRILKVGMQCG